MGAEAKTTPAHGARILAASVFVAVAGTQAVPSEPRNLIGTVYLRPFALGEPCTYREQQALLRLNAEQAPFLEPAEAHGHELRATGFFQSGQYDLAIAEYSEAIRLDPTVQSRFHNRGLVYRKIGQFDLALADLDKAIELDPKNAVTFADRGVIRFESPRPGLLGMSIADFGEAIRLKPDFVEAYIGRAHAYCLKERYGDAIWDLSKVIDRDPGNAWAHYSRAHNFILLGETDVFRGDQEDIRLDLTEAIRLDPNLASAYFDRGTQYAKTNEIEKAVADFDRTLQIDPAFERANRLRDRLRPTLKSAAAMPPQYLAERLLMAELRRDKSRSQLYRKAVGKRIHRNIAGEYRITFGPKCKPTSFNWDLRIYFKVGEDQGKPVFQDRVSIRQAGFKADLVQASRGLELSWAGVTVEDAVVFHVSSLTTDFGFHLWGSIKGNAIELRLDAEEHLSLGLIPKARQEWIEALGCVFILTPNKSE